MGSSCPGGPTTFFVTETSGGAAEKPERGSWEDVAAPVIVSAVQDGGNVVVDVNAEVGYDGADEVNVVMTDSEGKELASKRSIAEKSLHSLTFTPEDSGTYTFTAALSREGCEDKASESVTAQFLLPLGVPALSSATSAGGGKVALTWSAVREADRYSIYCDGVKVDTVPDNEYTVTGLTVGEKYSFQVAACRGEEESALSAALEAVATAEAQTVWGFTRYGIGFFAARNARITASDIQLTTIDPADDLPAEEKPVTVIEPTVTIHSASITTDEDYTLNLIANVAGRAEIRVDGENAGTADLTGGVRCDRELTLAAPGEHQIQVIFTPDPNQELGADTVLSSYDPITVTHSVTWNTRFAELDVIYAAPEGTAAGEGTKASPVDIYTAVDNVRAGQTIELMGGEYKLSRTLTIQRGIDGTAEAPITMRPEGERVVLDFQRSCAGIVHGGDCWVFEGFDVTNSQNGQKGFQVSGSHNVLYDIHTYHNGNTGIQISRYSGADTGIAYWPSHNLIRSCISYGNADAGYEDADGFAAKLTCGQRDALHPERKDVHNTRTNDGQMWKPTYPYLPVIYPIKTFQQTPFPLE